MHETFSREERARIAGCLLLAQGPKWLSRELGVCDSAPYNWSLRGIPSPFLSILLARYPRMDAQQMLAMVPRPCGLRELKRAAGGATRRGPSRKAARDA